jgi:hypothetical protein
VPAKFRPLRRIAEAVVESVIPAPESETATLPGWTSGLLLAVGVAPVVAVALALLVEGPVFGMPVAVGVSETPPDVGEEVPLAASAGDAAATAPTALAVRAAA